MSAPIWLGVASPKPQPRLLKSSMFGHVVDAFDEKTIHKIGLGFLNSQNYFTFFLNVI